MRRLILQDPLARSANWSRNIALFALAVAAIGVLLSRKGLDARTALAIEASALALAATSIFFAFIAFAVIWFKGFRGLGLALLGLTLSAVMFAYPAYVILKARSVPSVADVSTDTADPPSFVGTAAALAARHGSTPPRHMARADIQQQKRLDPDLQTLNLDADVGDVMDAIHKLLKRRHWKITAEVDPVNYATGHVDVVLTPALMGFPVDLTLRVRELGRHTQVDIRSVSRSPWSENPGANVARVDDFVSDLEDAVSNS